MTVKNLCMFSITMLALLIMNMKGSYANVNMPLNDTFNFQTSVSDSADNKSNENAGKILSELFPDYLVIKNSLSANDSVTAQRQALEFLENIQNKSKDIDKSTIPRSWELFMKYAPEAKSRIAASSSLAEQRFFFGVLSNYIIELMKSYGMNNQTVYILQCRDKSILGSGKWLSDFNDDKNPFLGPGNENCIEVIESKMY